MFRTLEMACETALQTEELSAILMDCNEGSERKETETMMSGTYIQTNEKQVSSPARHLFLVIVSFLHTSEMAP